jgi:hypothetical protein
VTVDELFDELRRLDGKFVGVRLCPTGVWDGSALHAQGRFRQDVVDQPENGVALGIGSARRLGNEWSEVEILSDDVESAVWRDDLLQGGRPVLAVTMRGGALLVIAP